MKAVGSEVAHTLEGKLQHQPRRDCVNREQCSSFGNGSSDAAGASGSCSVPGMTFRIRAADSCCWFQRVGCAEVGGRQALRARFASGANPRSFCKVNGT